MTDGIETCVTAAVRSTDGWIWPCRRHHEGLQAGGRAGMKTTQGFLTSLGRFVDRAEGYRLQRAAGIESVAEGGYRGEILFSEDLY